VKSSPDHFCLNGIPVSFQDKKFEIDRRFGHFIINEDGWHLALTFWRQNIYLDNSSIC
jgi:hypothetical protein